MRKRNPKSKDPQAYFPYKRALLWKAFDQMGDAMSEYERAVDGEINAQAEFGYDSQATLAKTRHASLKATALLEAFEKLLKAREPV